MGYSNLQIEGAIRSAKLHGFCEPSREQCIEFLNWYHSHKIEYGTEIEAIQSGLSRLVPTGCEPQAVEWQRIFSA